jgi:hypothetical protein
VKNAPCQVFVKCAYLNFTTVGGNDASSCVTYPWVTPPCILLDSTAAGIAAGLQFGWPLPLEHHTWREVKGSVDVWVDVTVQDAAEANTKAVRKEFVQASKLPGRVLKFTHRCDVHQITLATKSSVGTADHIGRLFSFGKLLQNAKTVLSRSCLPTRCGVGVGSMVIPPKTERIGLPVVGARVKQFVGVTEVVLTPLPSTAGSFNLPLAFP